MLRIQSYDKQQHYTSLKNAFKEIFHNSEFDNINKDWISDMSYVCIDRRNTVQGFILVNESTYLNIQYSIQYLGIMPRYRKLGYAKRLVELVISNKKLDSVYLSVLSNNVEANEVCKKIGFEVIEKIASNSDECTLIYCLSTTHKCYRCGKHVKKHDIIMEDTPVSIEMTNYGIHQVFKKEPVCYQCQTKIES